MRVEFAYGTGVLPVELPEQRTTVVRGRPAGAAPDASAEVVRALRSPLSGPPLRDRLRPGQRVAIAVCDGTRPQPRRVVLPAVLAELEGVVDLDDVVVLVATGTHRGNSDDELAAMLGPEVMGAVRVVNHDARDEAGLTWMGRMGHDVPVFLNSEWARADVTITTGLVEPHFFAGFSGGPKLVAPGLAGLQTTLTLHDAARIGHSEARWGVTTGNPVHDDIRAIAERSGVSFALDVVLDSSGAVAHAFGGDLGPMHSAACDMVREHSMTPVTGPFDVVVTSNGGFPLDQNLYQAVKGMSAAAQVVRPGGTIVCISECRDGFPDHGAYRQQLTSSSSLDALLASIVGREQTVADQWQLQIQASIMQRARVVVHTGFLSDGELAAAHIQQVHDVAEVVQAAGPDARVCALPEGPYAVPYLA